MTVELTYTARPCPVCGSEDGGTVVAESTVDPSVLTEFAFASRKLPEYMHHRLVLCPVCGLLYANPVPNAASLGRAYDEAAFASGEEARYASRTYADHVRPLLARLPRPLSAIDVGTGDGAFLEQLIELGFQDVHGVEPSAAPIAAAKPEIRERIVHDIFRADRFPPASVSLITCFQTIEHLPDPLQFCRVASALLRPGGALMIVCHDRRALTNRLLGWRSPIYDIEHLQLFERRSAEQLLARSGFAGLSSRTILNRYPLRYWARLAPIPGRAKGRALRWLDGHRAGGLPVTLPVGNLRVVGFQSVSHG